jgi:hypothetical protein
LWGTGGAGVFASKRDNREIILGVGEPGGLGPKQRDDLEVVAPAGLVAKGFESDLGARGGGEGLADDTHGTLVAGHTPRLPLQAGLGVPKEVGLTAVAAVGLRSPAGVRGCNAAATSKSVRRREARMASW